MDEQGVTEQVEHILRNRWALPSITGVVGIAVGATAMYFWEKRKLNQVTVQIEEDVKSNQLQLDFERAEKEREFNAQIQEAADVTRELKELGVTVLTNLNNLRQGEHPEVVVEQVVQPPLEVGQQIQYPADEGKEVEITSTPAITRNVFDGDDTWDYELERNNRTKERPYVIHVDEFVADEMGYDSQSTLTWYEGDRVLTDSHDVPIYNAQQVAGELRFGHGSGDQNVVYVRNEKLQAEYEILRDPGSYEDVVLGGRVENEFEAGDLKHSRTPRKFRSD